MHRERGMDIVFDNVMRRQKAIILFSLGAALATTAALLISMLGLWRSPI